MPNFVKNHLRGYTPLGQIHTENYRLRHFCGLEVQQYAISTQLVKIRQVRTTIQDLPYVHGLIINWHIQDGNV